MIYWSKTNGQIIKTNDRPESIAYCESLGWKLADKPKEEKPAMVDADKGSGIPGTNEWHKSAILGMSEKEEVIQYLSELGIIIDQRGNLDRIKAKAIIATRAKDDNSDTDNKRRG
jgi:hypothetical protein